MKSRFLLSFYQRGFQRLLLVNSLSLDAPLIAISWQHLLAKILDVSLQWNEVAILFLVTWLAYAGDRLLDSLQQKDRVSELPRHQFAGKHRRLLGILWSLLFLLTILLGLLTVERDSLLVAVVLGAAVVSYFALCFYFPGVARSVVPREVVVSGVFVTGAFFFPLTHLSTITISESTATLYCIAGTLWCLGFLNCLGISCWEQQADREAGEVTLATTFPAICNFYPAICGAFVCGLLIVISGHSVSLSISPFFFGVIASLLLLCGIHLSKISIRLKPILADGAVIVPWFFVIAF